jgi:zinc-ribbon domain
MSSEIHQQPPDPIEEQLCTCCAAPNRPTANFCAKCGAPLNPLVMISPFERLFSEGFIYRQATEHPRKLITVLGIWFLFGMVALGGLMITILAVSASMDLATLIEVILGSAIIAFSLLIILKTTRNYLIRNRIEHHQSGGTL